MSYNWHARFLQQALWTRAIRQSLYARARIAAAQRVIEIGCGTGVLTAELNTLTQAASYGLDMDNDNLTRARLYDPRTRFIRGDAITLPFPDQTFDLAFCHFFFLWVKQPLKVINEMRRITHQHGHILALAEPDYGGRIDYPPSLEKIGSYQTAALAKQGADPFMGRKLASLFNQAGLDHIETGVLGGQWVKTANPEFVNSEWDMLALDLGSTEQAQNIHELKQIDKEAWQKGERILYVPTFYAWGIVP